MADQTAQIDWRDAAPVSVRFDDPYYSLHDGLAETRHVFLGGNRLPARFKPGFHVAELGFGTGLNLLTTWASWRATQATGTLHFTSFEQYPLARADMVTALAAFPELDLLAKDFLAHYRPASFNITLPDLDFHLITGDANQSLRHWPQRADAWYLDGFSPAKNPELWTAPLLQEVANHTKPGGTFATYTAAGHVRRALGAAGFSVARLSGYGQKRHMSAGNIAP